MGHRAEKQAWGGSRKAHKGEPKPGWQSPKIGRLTENGTRQWKPRHVNTEKPNNDQR